MCRLALSQGVEVIDNRVMILRHRRGCQALLDEVFQLQAYLQIERLAEGKVGLNQRRSSQLSFDRDVGFTELRRGDGHLKSLIGLPDD